MIRTILTMLTLIVLNFWASWEGASLELLMTSARAPSYSNACQWRFSDTTQLPFRALSPTQPLRTTSSRSSIFLLLALLLTLWIFTTEGIKNNNNNNNNNNKNNILCAKIDSFYSCKLAMMPMVVKTILLLRY